LNSVASFASLVEGRDTYIVVMIGSFRWTVAVHWCLMFAFTSEVLSLLMVDSAHSSMLCCISHQTLPCCLLPLEVASWCRCIMCVVFSIVLVVNCLTTSSLKIVYLRKRLASVFVRSSAPWHTSMNKAMLTETSNRSVVVV